MNRFGPYLGRFEIGADKESGGQLLLDGAGRSGERPTGVAWAQQHGFASRPPSGSLGYHMALGGRHSQLVVFGGENPEKRPALQPGNAALYDHNGHIVRVVNEGLKIDVKDQAVEIRQGSMKIIVSGNDAFIQIDPDKKLYLGGDPAVDSFARVQTEGGPSLNVYARIA